MESAVLGLPQFDIWYSYENEEINVDVDRRTRAFTIYATSDAALHLALRFQQEYAEEIYMFEGVNIAGAIPLNEVDTVGELRVRLAMPPAGPDCPQ